MPVSAIGAGKFSVLPGWKEPLGMEIWPPGRYSVMQADQGWGGLAVEDDLRRLRGQ